MPFWVVPEKYSEASLADLGELRLWRLSRIIQGGGHVPEESGPGGRRVSR